MKAFLYTALVAAVGLACAAPARGDSLLGYEVTATVDSPTLGNARSVPATQTVGSGVEFPSGTLELASNGVPTGTFIIGVGIDVRAASIDLDYTQSATATSATFNGYVFDFDPSSPVITGVSLDPLTTFKSSQLGLGFSDHEVTLNVEGLSFTPSSEILLDLDFAGTTVQPTVVPEPPSVLLLMTGCGLAGALMWQKRRSLCA